MTDAAGIAFAVCGDQVGNVEVPPAASSAMIGSKEYFRAKSSPTSHAGRRSSSPRPATVLTRRRSPASRPSGPRARTSGRRRCRRAERMVVVAAALERLQRTIARQRPHREAARVGGEAAEWAQQEVEFGRVLAPGAGAEVVLILGVAGGCGRRNTRCSRARRGRSRSCRPARRSSRHIAGGWRGAWRARPCRAGPPAS